ncbi:MAG TPA: LPXTG cell wall anchor domain-containing protein [Phototrophicaceae bacterium]|nr:LPXTG cell wall anchor domain-containing protein [Phototrophicaceae bacterium]
MTVTAPTLAATGVELTWIVVGAVAVVVLGVAALLLSRRGRRK